jgi:preprotein translocase subunit YajC
VKELASLLPLVGIFLVFWLLVIRPASRRNKEMARLQSDLRVGDQVMLSSGLYGTLRAVGDDPVEVELAEGLVVRVARAAVARVVSEPDAGDQPPVAEED